MPEPSQPAASDAAGAAGGLRPVVASALVFGSSAAVLVVELVSLRLLAPYLGLTLETTTLVIGTALAAIALGSMWGGRAADRTDPRRALGPLLGVSGAVVAAMPFLVRTVGSAGDPSITLLLAAVVIIVPGALLSAVTPMVTKLVLSSLEETGTVVGRLSGIGTVGAIAGTVLTGYVLVSLVPVSVILLGLGALLVLAGLLVEVDRRRWRRAAAGFGVVVAAGLASAVGPGSCDAETTYHCAQVEADPDRPGGRTLVLDNLRHSYVDLADPTHLEFEYVRAVASVTDVAHPGSEPLVAYHLGGGGLTFPRYLDVTRPGSSSVVSEIDGGVVEVDRERLGLRTGEGIEVRVEDARLGLGRLDDASRDLVVGDAFGGVSVPWHLTTLEAVDEIARVLTDDGVYVANLIDHTPLGFARAEVATLREAFDHVVVTAPLVDLPVAAGGEGTGDGGNLVVAASDRPLDTATLAAGLTDRDLDWGVLAGDDALDAWLDGADVLTDDHAPVDQLLTPYAR
ncbi:hypothetical protein GCM10023340_26650 [Nocardioides marinquilinus]|uniref:Spermidine synthase n=1 Tax=Nocardioides marinquilinus TaxID=1210400 RepID=A0ABP9PQX8_9ACTN